MVKGNMTPENNVIEVKEVIAFEKQTPAPTQPKPATNSGQSLPNQ
ncbi:MAG: hypothetical protein Q7R77_00970 [Candidatus Daviesbacteria bacterium]|nr:hypothetical protein [Candidatus Daviesbacteria bacterium]